MKGIIFDLGGTLFEFVGMSYLWTEYYEIGLQHVNKKYQLRCSEKDIKRAKEVLKTYNPRLHYREKEYSPESIFDKATRHWKNRPKVHAIIRTFFEGMKLETRVYGDVLDAFRQIRSHGDRIAFFTDLPSGMPDEIMKEKISDLLPYADFYISSGSCGYRKPNPRGLCEIARELELGMDKLVFIGDEKKDFETAKRANCRFIYIDRSGETDYCRNISQVLKEIYD